MKKSIDDEKQQANRDIEELKSLAKEGLDSEILSGKKELAKLDETIKNRRNTLNELEESETLATSSRDSVISVLDESILVKQTVLNTVTSRVTELESTKEVLESAISNLRGEKGEIETAIANLKATELTDQSTLDAINASIEERSIELTALIDDFDQKKEKYEGEINSLELKKYELIQQITTDRESHQRVAENLADRSKQLDALDTSLRVREQKIQSRERVLIRNSNLLNL